MEKAWKLYKSAKLAFENGKTLEAVDLLYALYELKIYDNNMLNNSILWLFVRILFRLSPKEVASVNDVFLIARAFDYEKPSEGYSILLKAALKHKAYADILEFIKWWRLKNLRPEDFVPEELVLKNGKKTKIPATAERAYMAIAGALIAKKDKDLVLIKAFIAQLHSFSVANPKFQWLPYFEARLILISGESRTEIMYKILPFVRHRRRDFWAWELLARLYENEKRLQISCFCMALLCGAEEEYLVKVRERFALVLLAQNFLAEAKCEALALITTKENQNMKIPPSVAKMQKESWWSVTEARKSNLKFYESNSSMAENLLFPQERMERAVVQGLDLAAKKVYFGVSRQKLGAFFYNKLHELKIGELIDVFLEETGKDKLYKLKKLSKVTTIEVHELLKSVEADLKFDKVRKNWFAEKQFVPEFLVKKFGITKDCNVLVKSHLLYDMKQGKFIWKIYELKPMDK